MRHVLSLLLALCFLVLLPGCFEKVEGTGRTQLILTSASAENAMGLEAYREVLKKEKRCPDPDINAFVARVGQRITAVVPDRGFKYQFTVLESQEANAFCLPGGEVCVYTGLLKYCQTEAGLAAVMGHEIAHAIARHGGERMSQNLIVQGVSTGLSAALQAKGVEPNKANLALAAFGGGAQIGFLLPYSRTHEYEADYLGLMYMSKAGYDPHEAAAFWTRFGKAGSGMPAFLSTHPAGADRERKMEEYLPKALESYEKSPKYGAGERVLERYLR